MLRSLAIRDMVLIETVEMQFQPGLNVLTGETGAGKSILLDSLGFVLGWRGRADLVRAGSAQGEVSAEFDLAEDHPARAILADAGLAGGEDLILRRTVTADGRKQAYVNDRRATAETLRSLSDTLVELHGQQDDRGLLDARSHRGLLDAFAEADAERLAVRAAWAARAEAIGALDVAREALEAAARDADYITHALAELEALDARPGEEPELDARRRHLRAAEQIREDVVRAAEALGPQGVEAPLAQAQRWLEAAAPRAEGALEEALDGMARVFAELSEVARSLDALRRSMGGDPAELEQVEERLFAIRALARKHQVQPDDLSELARDLTRRRAALDAGAGEIERLERGLKDAEAAYDAAAAALTATRDRAAKRLDQRMGVELKPLKLDRAVFRTELAAVDPGPEGRDRVRFAVATNPGAEPGPIERVASGGELSRFLLALKVCLSARAQGITLIFDEIDRGVGGATADAVGRRLGALGAMAQVLVVTHAPQVAARGAHHWRVGKTVSGSATRIDVAPLAPWDRVEEIARMLAGDTVTAAAREAARALLAG